MAIMVGGFFNLHTDVKQRYICNITAFLELVQIRARLMSSAFAANQFQVLCVSFMLTLLS